MPKVRLAAGADYLGAAHAERVVLALSDRPVGNWRAEAGPAGA